MNEHIMMKNARNMLSKKTSNNETRQTPFGNFLLPTLQQTFQNQNLQH